ncbi:helix-turn-helix domain-containing protein [Paenibacillus herberti]|uniref:AraC family transcriptional regulator n=1 Tax=Paenibacillus herberti TaxID=1619309 RepID=A0A229NWH2_9BACL|nr:helix-turn-helix domain-containing protein [Paenibacillus herberti]OXM14283.1 AraC family transcriptional regulator [Paenibacillus herberti]
MNKSYLRSRLFLNYALSYLLVLLVPLLLFAGTISQSASSNLRSEVERAHFNQLTQARNTVDSRMRDLLTIASRISYDTRLSSYLMHDPYFSSEGIKALDQYKATSEMIGELFLFFRGYDRIYSSLGMSELSVFYNGYAFRNWDPAQIEDELNQVQFPTLRPADLVRRKIGLEQSMLAYMVPITPNNPNPHATVMYLIEESQFNGLISSILGSYQGLTYVFDDKGQVLTSTQRGESLSKTDVDSLFRQPEGIHSLELNKTTHSVVSVKSEQNGWTYVTAMPSNQFFSSVVKLRSIMILILGTIAAAGAGLALLLARRLYGPIWELAAFASSQNKGPGAAAKEPDELGRIRSVLQHSSQMADLQEPYARNHFLLMLLKNSGPGILSPELLRALHMSFDRERYAVLVFGWEDEQLVDPAVYAGLQELNIPEAGAIVYGVELPEPRRMAFIVGFTVNPDSNGNDSLQATLNEVQRLSEGAGLSNPSIGVGRLYESPLQLSQSYIEALSAYESRHILGPVTVSRFDAISESREKANWLPTGLLLKLAQALKQGSYEVAAPTITECLSFIRAGGASLPLARAMYFDVLNTMLKSASELGVLTSDIPSPSSFHSMKVLEEPLLTLAYRICSEAESRAQTEERSLLDRALAYIHAHYADHSLSLESVADEHSISPSYFSRSFKEKTGQNFTPYVWQLRVEEVKRLLDETNDPIKDIIPRVGYLDAPNFIRKFKKETGLTPGQYRKRGQGGGAEAD